MSDVTDVVHYYIDELAIVRRFVGECSGSS